MSSDRKIYVHIGKGKCGSSTIQGYFSQNPNHITKNGRKLSYVVLLQSGVLYGENLAAIATKALSGYVSSLPVRRFRSASEFRQQFEACATFALENQTDVIISCENYIKHPEFFQSNALFENLGVEVEVLMYIRPPLDWLNSAYWQWGAWGGVDKNTWMKEFIQQAKWFTTYKTWREVRGVRSVRVGLATKDVLKDISQHLGLADLGNFKNLNKSVGFDVLKFFQRNSEFRREPSHNEYAFLLESVVSGDRIGAPWVIDEEFQDCLFEELGNEYAQFENHLPAEVWAEMRDDPRWWSKAPYVGRGSGDNNVSDIESADRLIGQLIEYIRLNKAK